MVNSRHQQSLKTPKVYRISGLYAAHYTAELMALQSVSEGALDSLSSNHQKGQKDILRQCLNRDRVGSWRSFYIAFAIDRIGLDFVNTRTQVCEVHGDGEVFLRLIKSAIISTERLPRFLINSKENARDVTGR